MRRLIAATLALGIVIPLDARSPSQGSGEPRKLTLPNKKDSVHFAVIGDAGTGGREQLQVAKQIAAYRNSFPFDFAIMLGDNLYGGEKARDYRNKFEIPYKPLLDAGVKFYAALGNHDNPNQRMYKPFNMNGERYYTFKSAKTSARFFALDSNYMDDAQLAWLKKELAASGSDWKIVYFHHPLYSSGERHGSDEVLRQKLEPIFVQNGVDVVFTGHEHFYERLKPQKGIHYFICGSSAKLRRGNIGGGDLTAKGFDQGYTFMLIEIDGDQMHFQTIAQDGRTVDSGVVQRNVKQTTSAK
ncbi:MAG: metallophosphoesterase family protein [Vicinamibacterales bacterium]